MKYASAERHDRPRVSPPTRGCELKWYFASRTVKEKDVTPHAGV